MRLPKNAEPTLANTQLHMILVDGSVNNNNNNFLTNNENIRNENECGDLECLFKTCHAAMEAFSQTLAYMNEVRMNDRVTMTMR